MSLRPYILLLTLDGKEHPPHTIQATSHPVAKEVGRQFLADHLDGKPEGSVSIGQGDDVSDAEWLGSWDFDAGSWTWQDDS